MRACAEPQAPIKGRGAASYVHGRYAVTTTHGEDDGWGSVYEDLARCARARRPRVTEERARSIVSRNDSPDIGFAASVNPYRGCEHGCVYCFARPSHAYLDLSPGLDFETKLFAKTNAAERLREELAQPVVPLHADRAGHQHRRLPADRTPLPHHPRSAWKCWRKPGTRSASSPRAP